LYNANSIITYEQLTQTLDTVYVSRCETTQCVYCTQGDLTSYKLQGRSDGGISVYIPPNQTT